MACKGLAIIPAMHACEEGCVCVAGQMDRDPYWSRPWPSAVALAKLILQQPSIVAGRRVCEVGAGLGIASIAAVLAGADPP